MNKHLNKTIQLISGQIISGLLTLTATIASARYCGPEVVSAGVSLILIMSLVVDIADFGSCSWASRELAAHRIGLNRYLRILYTKFSISFLAFPLIVLLNLIVFDLNHYLLFLGLYPCLWLGTNYIQQLLLVKSEIYFSQILQFIDRTSWLLVLPLSLLKINKFGSFVLPIIVGLILHITFGLVYISKRLRSDFDSEKSQNGENQKDIAHFGRIGLVTDIANLDTPIVTAITSLQEAGSYSLAQRFRNPSLIIFQSISIRIKPLAARGNRQEVIKFLRSERYLINFAIAGLIILSALSFSLADIIFGDNYEGVNLVLAFGFLIAIPSGISFIAISILSNAGFEKFVSHLVFKFVILNLSSVAILTVTYGILFSQISTLFITLIFMVWLVSFTRRYLKDG